MPINVYPDILGENLDSDAFDEAIDKYCQAIHDGCKGRGADVAAVIEALAHKDATTRHQIVHRYREMFNKDLAEVARKEFSGEFGFCMQALALPADAAEVAMIKKATLGVGATVEVLYAIICGRTNEEIERLKNTYNTMYNKDINALMSSELRGDNERLILNCLAGNEQTYIASVHTKEKAAEDAEYIHDKTNVFEIICAAPPEHLQQISRIYEDQYGMTLEKAIEKGLGGKAKEGLSILVGMKLEPYETMAKLFKKACAGIGTNDFLLLVCVVRYQNVMKRVMAAHFDLYNKVCLNTCHLVPVDICLLCLLNDLVLRQLCTDHT